MGKYDLTPEFGKNITLPQVGPIEPGSNAAIVAHLLQTREIAKHADIENIDTLYDCMQEYLLLCIQTDTKITNKSLYAACGLSIDLVSDWATGRRRASDPRYREFALTLKSICSQHREQAAAEGKLNPVMAIWWQKNYDGMRDDPVIEHTDAAPDRPADPDEIRAKYKHLLEDKSGERMVKDGKKRRRKAAKDAAREDKET